MNKILKQTINKSTDQLKKLNNLRKGEKQESEVKNDENSFISARCYEAEKDLTSFIIDANWVEPEYFVEITNVDYVPKEVEPAIAESFWLQNADQLAELFSFQNRNGKVKELIRYSGIPQPLRKKIWPHLTGITQKNKVFNYSDLLRTFTGKHSISTQLIEKDLQRTFSSEPKLKTPGFIDSMRNVLSVYSFVNPDIGYCQSMNFLVAVLLLNLNEEDAFWTLTTIIEDYLPKDFYTKTMIGIVVEQRVFKYLLDLKIPSITMHFEKLQIDIEPIIVRWFLCIFLTQFPLDIGERMMELFLFEGPVVLHYLALALFKMHSKEILSTDEFSEMFSLLQNMTFQTNIDDLLKIAFEINISYSKIIQLRDRYRVIYEKKFFEGNKELAVDKEAKTQKRKALTINKSKMNFEGEITPESLKTPTTPQIDEPRDQFTRQRDTLELFRNDDDDTFTVVSTTYTNRTDNEPKVEQIKLVNYKR